MGEHMSGGLSRATRIIILACALMQEDKEVSTRNHKWRM